MKSHQLRRTLGALTGAVWFSLVCIAGVAAAETTSPAKVYALGPDSEHPIRVENIRLTEPTVRTDDYCRHKFRIAEQPSVRLRLSEPHKTLKFVANYVDPNGNSLPGNIGGIVVKEPKESWCHVSGNAEGVNLPAGDYEIYIVSRYWREGTFTLTVTDPYRRASYPKVKPIQLPEKIEKPIVLAGRMEKGLTERIRCPVQNGRELSWGDDLVFARTPDFIIATTRPLSGLKAVLVPGAPTQHLRVVGPLEKALWNDDGRCSAGDLTIGGYSADGEYALFVGDKNATSKGSFRIVLSTPGTQVDPFDITVPIPDELPVADRVVKKFYPLLSRDTTFRDLFLKAPRALFVFPTLDLDHEIASGSGVYPKTDEPLLVIRGREPRDPKLKALSLRGVEFFIPVKYLSGSPRGIVRVPDPREGGFDRMIWRLAPDREAQFNRELKSAEGREDAAQNCFENYYRKKTGGSSRQAWNLLVAQYKNKKLVRVENLGDRFQRAATKTCRVDEAYAAMDKVYKRKGDAIEAEIRSYLSKLRARFASPPTQTSRL